VAGPAGTPSNAYLDAYIASDPAFFGAGSDVAFPTQIGTPVGITANTANTIFTVTSAGTYSVTVRLVSSNSNYGPAYFQTQVNGAAVGPYDTLQVGFLATVTWTRIVYVTAGGTIAISTTGGYADAGSEITIIRIA